MSSYHSIAELPAPDAAQIEVSSRLVEIIVNAIEQAGGVISFRDYMYLCLYQPGAGYYVAGSTKFGASGDFITAPETTPLFGQTLANAIHQRFTDGFDRHILEFGAGSGRLCADIMARLSELSSGLESYAILEPSPELQERQQSYLQQHLGASEMRKVSWLSRLPENFSGLVLGNEVLDAMPVHVVVKDAGWRELGVGFDGERLVWREFSHQSEAVQAIRTIDASQTLPEGYCTEINLNYLPWCRALAECCDRAAAILIDYGYTNSEYYHPSRSTGTLICYYRHRAHPDPLIFPGLQDITAFVDFEAFAAAARAAGWEIQGLSTQSEFLLGHGLLQLADGENEPIKMMELAQQIKQLTLPGEMGEKFKVIEFSKNLS